MLSWQHKSVSQAYRVEANKQLKQNVKINTGLWLVHGSAVIVVFLLDPPFWLLLVAITVLVCSLTANLGRHASRNHPQAIKRIVWSTDQQWYLYTADRNRYSAILLPPAYVQSSAVILSFRTDTGQTSHVLLIPDMLTSEAFRKLRVRLQLEMR